MRNKTSDAGLKSPHNQAKYAWPWCPHHNQHTEAYPRPLKCMNENTMCALYDTVIGPSLQKYTRTNQDKDTVSSCSSPPGSSDLLDMETAHSPLQLGPRSSTLERERNVSFNDALNTFYLRLYGVRHIIKDYSDSEKGNPLPPHRLLLSINSKGSFICTIPQTG